MTYLVVTREISAQPVLLVRRRVKRSDIGKAIEESLPLVARYARRVGIALAGRPVTRFFDWGPGVTTIETGLPVSALGEIAGEGAITADTLPGGLAAVTMHNGSYEKLIEAHAAIQQWVEGEGFVAQGAPWETYLTDPREYPDAKDWLTEVFWPLAPYRR